MNYDVDIRNIRMMKFYYMVVNLSRILNKRKEVNDEDIHLLKLILENINCKVDVAVMTNYDVKGGGDITKLAITEKLIEESKNSEDMFGIPEDDFK